MKSPMTSSPSTHLVTAEKRPVFDHEILAAVLQELLLHPKVKLLLHNPTYWCQTTLLPII